MRNRHETAHRHAQVVITRVRRFFRLLSPHPHPLRIIPITLPMAYSKTENDEEIIEKQSFALLRVAG